MELVLQNGRVIDESPKNVRVLPAIKELPRLEVQHQGLHERPLPKKSNKLIKLQLITP